MPNLVELLQVYGVFIVFAIVLVEQAGLPIPAFPILIVAGASSVGGEVSWAACLAVAVGACLISDSFWFTAGRRHGQRILRLLCKISLSPDYCVRQTEDRFLRYGPKSLLVSKFIPGFNVIASPMSGALGVSAPRFIAFSMSGSLLWSASGMALGAYFHKSVDQLLLLLSSMGTTALYIILGLLAVFVLYKYVERRRFQQGMQIERISMDELSSLMSQGHAPVLVDARSLAAQTLEQAIPGALVYHELEAGKLLTTIDKDSHIVVYCSCPNDVTAAQLAQQLKASGFHRARPLRGGLEAWNAHQTTLAEPDPQHAT